MPLAASQQWAYNLEMKHLTFPIIIEADSDGYYVSCPGLQGCYSQGDTYEEALTNIKDAIREYLDAEVPTEAGAEIREVEVPV